MHKLYDFYIILTKYKWTYSTYINNNDACMFNFKKFSWSYHTWKKCENYFDNTLNQRNLFWFFLILKQRSFCIRTSVRGIFFMLLYLFNQLIDNDNWTCLSLTNVDLLLEFTCFDISIYILHFWVKFKKSYLG